VSFEKSREILSGNWQYCSYLRAILNVSSPVNVFVGRIFWNINNHFMGASISAGLRCTQRWNYVQYMSRSSEDKCHLSPLRLPCRRRYVHIEANKLTFWSETCLNFTSNFQFLRHKAQFLHYKQKYTFALIIIWDLSSQNVVKSKVLNATAQQVLWFK